MTMYLFQYLSRGEKVAPVVKCFSSCLGKSRRLKSLQSDDKESRRHPEPALGLAPSHSSEGHIADISPVSHPLPMLRTSASAWQDPERFLLPPHIALQNGEDTKAGRRCEGRGATLIGEKGEQKSQMRWFFWQEAQRGL